MFAAIDRLKEWAFSIDSFITIRQFVLITYNEFDKIDKFDELNKLTNLIK
jgi:hypothetical protein